MILYVDKGKVKLSVGADEVISSQKINDGDWHNVCGKMLKCCFRNCVSRNPKFEFMLWVQIKSSMKQHSFHLAVDGIQTPDGHSLKGFTHDLQSPVYVGHGTFQMLHKTQVQTCNFPISASSLNAVFCPVKVASHFFSQERMPQKSIIGCIQDIRVSKVLLVDPAVSRGVMPCFKGVKEKGAYFAGNGTHLILGLTLHVFTCV